MKLKIYHGIKEITNLEVPDDIHAVGIDDRDIIFIDDDEHQKVYNVVLGDPKVVTCRLQRGLPSTICKRSYANLKNTNHMKITVRKETEK